VDSHWLNRWLTLGANVAVLIGIVLLIVELDQNRDMMRAQIRHELAMGIVDLLQTPASNEQLADLMYRAQTGGELTPTELFQFQMRTNALFRYWEDVHYQYREGLYDDIEFGKQRGAWKASLSHSRQGRKYWCQVRSLYSPEFMAEMDNLLPVDCTKDAFSMNADRLNEFATQYTAAWCSQDAASVAAFFADAGTLYVNGSPAIGREPITGLASWCCRSIDEENNISSTMSNRKRIGLDDGLLMKTMPSSLPARWGRSNWACGWARASPLFSITITWLDGLTYSFASSML